MTALFNIARWTPKSEDEKISQALFGGYQVVRRINSAQYFVVRNAPIKGSNQALETLVANERMNLGVFHYRDDWVRFPSANAFGTHAGVPCSHLSSVIGRCPDPSAFMTKSSA